MSPPVLTAGAELLDAAAALAGGPGRRGVLGIVGAPGAGKTTLTLALLAGLSARLGPDAVAHAPMDGFHLADVQLDRLGLRQVKGAPPTFDAAGYAAMLARAASDPDDVYWPGFERELEQPIAAAIRIPAQARLVLTEGNYLLLDEPAWHRARASCDEVWAVVVDPQVRVERLVARHHEFGKTLEQAREWVLRSDEANALIVDEGLDRADRVVLATDSGWRFSR